MYRLGKDPQAGLYLNARLNKLIDFIQSNIPYYKDHPISIIDKSTILNHEALFMTRNNYEKRMLWTKTYAHNSWTEKQAKKEKISFLECTRIFIGLMRGYSLAQVTGGSSGQFFYQWYSFNDLLWGIYSFTKGWINMGWSPEKSAVVYYFHGSNTVQLLKYLPSKKIFSIEPELTEDGNDITDRSFHAFLECLESTRPYLLITFPNLLFRLCQKIYSTRHKLKYQPRAIDISADFLFTCQYQFIQSLFTQSDIRMSYGTVEFGQIAQQVPDNLYTYQVYNDLCYIENNHNYLVVTHLRYRTMPLVRYQTDDIGHVYWKDKHQYINGLVGKQNKHYDFLAFDSEVNKINQDRNIINIKIDDSQGIHYYVVKNKTLMDVHKLKNISHDNKIIVLDCNENSCRSTDQYNRKVTPILNEFRFFQASKQ